MKRLPTKPIKRHEFKPSHLQILRPMFPLIPLLILTAISALVPRPALAQEKVANGKCPPSNA